MEKISVLENSLFEEREKRSKFEDELKILKTLTIPNLEKQLEEKESLCRTVFIEKIRLEKDLTEKIKSSSTNSLTNPNSNNNKENNQNISPNIINIDNFVAGENMKNLITKLEYVQNIYKDLKKKYSDLQSEKLRMEQNLLSKIDLENEKVEILNRQIKDLENSINLKNQNIKSLTESNKNLLSEINILNINNNDLKKINEVKISELDFTKKELEKYKQIISEYQTKLKNSDESYSAISKCLADLKNNMSDLELSNYMFNIIRIRSLYESNTSLMFSKDLNGQYIVIIKYVTTSVTLNILDIEEISVVEEHLLLFTYKAEKNMKAEKFRSKENETILKIYNKMKNKALQILDEKNVKNTEVDRNKKLKMQLQKNLLDIF